MSVETSNRTEWLALLLGIGVVAGIAWAVYAVAFGESDKDWVQDSTTPMLARACVQQLRKIDSGAAIPPRPTIGNTISWPRGAGLTIHGTPVSASCVEDVTGRPPTLTLNGRDVYPK